MASRSHRLVDELFARARAAVDAARLQNRRTALLNEFVRRGRTHGHELPLRCAWCGRISLGGEFVDPGDFLAHGVLAAIDDRSTHGICPDCFEREMARER